MGFVLLDFGRRVGAEPGICTDYLQLSEGVRFCLLVLLKMAVL